MMGTMAPDKPKTPHRTIRVPDDLWDAAREKATDEGRNLSEVIREFLTDYVEDDQASARAFIDKWVRPLCEAGYADSENIHYLGLELARLDADREKGTS